MAPVWPVSLTVGRSWWASHQDLGTLYHTYPDRPRKELWHLGKLLPPCMFEPALGVLWSPVPGDSRHVLPQVHSPYSQGTWATPLRASAFPPAKFLWGFFSWRSTLLAFRSPCNTHLFLHAWKSLFSRSCAGEAVVSNATHSLLLFVHVPISALHAATFYLNHRVTCRASPHSTSESQKETFSSICCPHQAYSLGWFE